jgi:hypothetical protein
VAAISAELWTVCFLEDEHISILWPVDLKRVTANLKQTEADLKGKNNELTVTCLNAILSAENDNRSPESKNGHLETKTALVTSAQCYLRTVCCLERMALNHNLQFTWKGN